MPSDARVGVVEHRIQRAEGARVANLAERTRRAPPNVRALVAERLDERRYGRFADL